MLAFLNTPTFPVFSPPTYFNPAFILRFYLSFIFYLAFIYCVLLFTNIIYHVMRTDTCNKPHTLRDAVTGRNRNRMLLKQKFSCDLGLYIGTVTTSFNKCTGHSDWANSADLQMRHQKLCTLARHFSVGHFA